MPRASSVRPTTAVLALALGALACEPAQVVSAPASPPSDQATAKPPAGIPGLRLEVQFLPPALVAGARVSPSVYSYVDPWTPVPLPPLTWQTTDREVLAIEWTYERGAMLHAVAPGSATITIAGGGVTTRVAVAVLPVPDETSPLDSSGVVVSDFHFLTYGDGRVFVPQLTMRTIDGRAYDVLRVQFVIPGLPTLHTCSSVRALAATPTAVFVESYGDWELEYTADASPVPGARATATIDLRRATGGTIRLVVDGPLLPGGPPTTFTGGRLQPWSCS